MTAMTAKKEKPGLTRDRIIGFLLKQPSTTAALAEELEVTPNAVRSQLALLEREGIVEVRGALKGSRRPSVVYGIRAGAEVLPSRAYPALVPGLVRALAQKLPDKDFTALMRELGKQIADGAPKTEGSPRERVEAALGFLRSLGSDADMTVAKGKIVVAGRVCPIARAVQADERSCIAMEALLKELTGLPVTEHCNHGAQQGCRFEFKLPLARS
jgi:predicted ArsR family transcriptional regulator